MDRARRPLGRRRRRLYWTIAFVSVALVLGTAAGYAVFRSSRVETYRPGEKLAEITSKLDLGIPEDAPEVSFVEVTAEAGLDGYRAFAGDRTSQLPEDMGPGAAWGDYDGDGDLDLIVTGYDVLRLFRNAGGTFSLDSAIADREGFWTGASWSDFDLDGDLDLYVCGYVQYVEDTAGALNTTRQYGRAVPYTLNPASFEPRSNLLFRNDGRGGFEETAEALGVDNSDGRSLGALWHDLDGDGRPDLYVANDISDNALFLNRGDRFENVSHPAWVADYRGAMGLTAGDWNRDGDDDLFITHWIAQENALYDSLLVDLADRGEESALRFMDVADQRGLGQIALQFIGWGTEFADLDSDGWLDLVVANGSTFETDGEPRRLRPLQSFLFWNRRGESFYDLAPLIPAFSEPRVSRGLALSDYDGDGDLDLLFVDRDGGVRLLRNDTPQGNRVALRLERPGGGSVEGARITLHTPSGSWSRTANSVSYLSQSSRTLHFGLGDVSRVENVEVRWPEGRTETFEPVAINALSVLAEGLPEPRRIDSWNAPAARALSREELDEFWRLERAGMDAVKVDRDCEQAIELFEQALALNPAHGDSLYYLGNCLAETGDVEAGLVQFAELMRVDPLSHRAHKRWGTLRAIAARNADDLDRAVERLERAAAINPEETGVSLVLGEVELIRGNPNAARKQLDWVVGANPQSGEAWFMLAYLESAAGQPDAAVDRLRRAAATREKERRPPGVVAEGEVRRKMHSESTPFVELFEAWDGSLDPETAHAPLRARLESLHDSLAARARSVR